MMGTTDFLPRRRVSFQWILSAAIVLLALVMVAFSYRIAHLTCQRGSGICVVSYAGLFTGPQVTFRLDDLTDARLEVVNSQPGDEAVFRVWLDLQDGSLIFNHTPVSSRTAFFDAFSQVNSFIDSAFVPEVAVELPDPRINPGMMRIFLVCAGLGLFLVNAAPLARTIIIPFRRFLAQPVGSPPPADAANGQPGTPWSRSDLWLRWMLSPVWTLVVVFFSIALLDAWYQSARFTVFTDNNTDYQLIFTMIDIILVCLGLFGPQAWIIHRLKMSAWKWIVFSTFGAFIFLAFYFGLILFIGSVDLPEISLEAGLALLGLALGGAVGLLQWPVLRKRLAHASRWVLASIIAGEIISLIVYLLKDRTMDYEYPWLFITVCYAVYMGVTGAALVWLLDRSRLPSSLVV